MNKYLFVIMYAMCLFEYLFSGIIKIDLKNL